MNYGDQYIMGYDLYRWTEDGWEYIRKATREDRKEFKRLTAFHLKENLR